MSSSQCTRLRERTDLILSRSPAVWALPPPLNSRHIPSAGHNRGIQRFSACTEGATTFEVADPAGLRYWGNRAPIWRYASRDANSVVKAGSDPDVSIFVNT